MSETILGSVKALFARLDKAASSLFVPNDPAKPGILNFIGTLAGRAVLLGAVALVVVLIANALRGPLTSVRFDAAAETPKGAVYGLPLTEFRVSVTLDLLHCRLAPALTSSSERQVELKVRQTFSIHPHVIADPDYRFVIRAGDIQHPLLSNDFSAMLAGSGTLLSLGHASPSVTSDIAPIRQALLDATSGELDSQTSTLPGETLEQEACAQLPTGELVMQAPDDGAAPASEDGETILNDDGALSIRTEATLIAAGREIFIKPRNSFQRLSAPVIAALKKYDVAFMLQPRDPAPKGAELESAVAGIVYRYPVEAFVYVCRTTCLLSSKFNPEAVILAIPLALYGAGQEAILPIERGWFGQRRLDASFDSLGGLQKIVADGTDDGTEAGAVEAPAL